MENHITTTTVPQLIRITLTVALLLTAMPAAWATTYYSQSSSAPNTLANWNSLAGGSGSTPANFTAGDIFVIQSGHTMTADANWTLAGGATIQINSGGILEGNAKTISLGGNLVNNGTLQSMVGGGATTMSFTSLSTYSGTGTINPGTGGSSRINWLVNSGATLTLGANFAFLNTGGIHRNFTVNGTLDCRTFSLTGGSGIDFILGNGATLITANANGINGSLVGFAALSLTSLNPTANYLFNGSAAQVAGSYLPATVNKLTITNPTGITLGGSLTVSNTLTCNGTITLNVVSGSLVAGQSYALIQYTTFSGSGAFVLGSLPPGVFGTLGTDGNSMVLMVSSAPRAGDLPAVDIVRANGAMHLRFNPETGYSYKVISSSDLISWDHAVSLRGQNLIEWPLTASQVMFPKRFFRVGKVVAQGLSELARWPAFQATPGSRLQIGLIGDSYTQNRSRYTKRLKQTLAAHYGNLGAGFLGFASFAEAGLNGSVDETELNYTINYSQWTTTNGGGYGPDAGHVTSLLANSSLAISVLKTVESLKFYYANKPGTAGFRYRIQSGAWTTIASDASVVSLGINTVDVRSYTAPYTIDVEALGVGVSLIGAEAIKTGAGVVVHKLGASGGRAVQFAANTPAKDALNELGLDLAVIMFGTNEQAGNQTPAAFKTALQNIITSLRASRPNMDVVLMLPCYTKYETEEPKAYPLHAYGQVMTEVATANHAVFFDFTDVFGPASELPNLIDSGLMYTDRVHPTTTGVGSGGYLMADTIALSILSEP